MVTFAVVSFPVHLSTDDVMRIAVFNPASGEILRIVSCPDFAAEHQAGDGETSIEVDPEVGDATHKIENGVVVPK